MAVYIRGIGFISPQGTGQKGTDAIAPRNYHTRMIQCPEVVVDPGLDDKYLRRMSRMIRLGWIASKMCREDSGVERPDAIITGSGWGSIKDSEKFLLSVIRNNEGLLSPTPFIQSTHNAVGAQIAMLLNSYDYNMSYAHRSFAFEHALLDAMLRLESKESKHVLCGGFDEITENQFTLYDRLEWWRRKAANSLDMIRKPGEGSIAGEGFNFFLLQTDEDRKAYAEVKWVETIFNDDVAAESRISNRLSGENIDWVFAGLNGDRESDRSYRKILSRLFPGGVNLAVYKHLCGEYLTSTAYAMTMAAMAIREQNVPAIMAFDTPHPGRSPGTVLVYNHHKGKYHSFILLSHPV